MTRVKTEVRISLKTKAKTGARIRPLRRIRRVNTHIPAVTEARRTMSLHVGGVY
jgi:hypothetical protein